jgi:glutamate-1-semialdehyde 2,1-aminomutase
MQYTKSKVLYDRASKFLVGGVDSPVRAFKAVGGTPLFIRKAKGSRVWDEDGNSYIDYVCSWGPLILGAAHPKVVSAIRAQAAKGTSFGAPTELETELAELIIHALPSIERLRFVNSGTEAAMSALRLARAYTKREKIVKFEGCYHGHVDSLLVKGGSGMATFGVPDSAGVTKGAAADTLSTPYNNADAVKRIFEELSDSIAAVIVEPVAGNMGTIPPKPGFLEDLRKVTQKNGAFLIFDEVITGFRVAHGGAQELFNVQPDLTCLGKIIGGGLPVAAYGGSAEIMNLVSPLGPVYQAGTLSGNPLAMAAGIATLNELNRKGIYTILERRSAQLAEGILNDAAATGCLVRLNRVGSMLGLFFTVQEVTDYATAKSSDTDKYREFFHLMLENGVYLPPSAFETNFVSTAHTDTDIAQTNRAVKSALDHIRTKSDRETSPSVH